ncbi:16S rRNA (guanine(527)-N(7))-methyltransferase RsmG [Litorimonas sp. RW-G-Af-16]
MSDYIAWQQLLLRWNKRINLVAPKSLADFWRRHALDSWQICQFLPEKAANIVDFGSGAGFPAISAAIQCKNIGQGRVLMIESAGKKASFLKQVIRDLGLPADVSSDRIEKIAPLGADVITARAFAPLDRLLEYAAPHSHAATEFILLKGETVEQEIETARDRWTFDYKTVKSVSADSASVLLISNVKTVAPT